MPTPLQDAIARRDKDSALTALAQACGVPDHLPALFSEEVAVLRAYDRFSLLIVKGSWDKLASLTAGITSDRKYFRSVKFRNEHKLRGKRVHDKLRARYGEYLEGERVASEEAEEEPYRIAQLKASKRLSATAQLVIDYLLTLAPLVEQIQLATCRDTKRALKAQLRAARSQKQIAKHINRHPNTVSKAMQELHAERRRAPDE